jgi:hypothetical protein
MARGEPFSLSLFAFCTPSSGARVAARAGGGFQFEVGEVEGDDVYRPAGCCTTSSQYRGAFGTAWLISAETSMIASHTRAAAIGTRRVSFDGETSRGQTRQRMWRGAQSASHLSEYYRQTRRKPRWA